MNWQEAGEREGNHGESMKQWKRTVECPGPDKGRGVNVLSCNVEIYICYDNKGNARWDKEKNMETVEKKTALRE